MSLQNIGAANSDDAFYRYKMPRMITKIEGRGNGIKTNIVNMVDIAKALARPPSYTTKYFGCELGAQSKFDVKTGVSLVNGAHDTQKLAGLLEIFIKKYVQCYGCGNPETEVIITKTQMLTLKCAACGFVSDVDMRDKLTTFILKNPPEPKKGSKEKKAMRRAEKERLKEGEAADEELKKIKRDAKKKGAAHSKGLNGSKIAGAKKKATSSDEERSSPPASQADDNNTDEDDDVQWAADTSAEAARQRIEEQLTSATADLVMLSTQEKHAEDRKEQKQLEVVTTNKETNTSKDLVEEIKNKLQTGSSPNEIASFLSSLPGNPKDVMIAFYEALLAGITKGFAPAVTKKKNFLAAVTDDDTSQFLLLHAIEAFCNKFGGPALKEVALVVKVLYDSDVFDEEALMQWYKQGLDKNANAAIWKNMKPFIEWLKNAESESDDE